jgi:anti-sigma factor RsiW
MKGCDLVEVLIDFVADELPPEEVERIRQHLTQCPPCASYVETYQLTIHLVRRLPPVAPPVRLLERLRAAAQQDASE